MFFVAMDHGILENEEVEYWQHCTVWWLFELSIRSYSDGHVWQKSHHFGVMETHEMAFSGLAT